MADDNVVIRSSVGRLLRLLDFEPVLVANGRDAVKLVASQHFDVVLLDVQMPEMDGFEAASLMRMGRNGQGLWIVGVSASLDEGLAKASGMDEFLAKPFRLKDLVKILARYQCMHSLGESRAFKLGSGDLAG